MKIRTKLWTWMFLLSATACWIGQGCDANDPYQPQIPDGGWIGSSVDTGVLPAPDLGGAKDLPPVPDGLPTDEGGPTISIISPADGEIIVATLLKVTAKVTDPQGVDPRSVTVSVQGGDTLAMTAQAKVQDQYEALIELDGLAGELKLWVSATDLEGHTNTEIRAFARDPGPRITFINPIAGGYYKGSLLVQALVEDPEPIDSVKILVGKDALKLDKVSLSEGQQLYTAELIFDDPFDPPLSGKQVLTATAMNLNQATTIVQQVFHVDNVGPMIQIKSHKPGDIIGGTVTLAAQVSDPAGLLLPSVQCVIGSGEGAQTVALSSSAASPMLYEGQFDSRTFNSGQLWPVVSFRAADVLGNESHVDIQVGLDNGPPVLELSPAGRVFFGRKNDLGELECSHPIDVVGADAAKDMETVPQIVPIRAWIEDQGNEVKSAKFVPVSLIDDTTVWLYVLDDTTKPLVVDTTGDGYCDSINPQVVPLSSAPQAGKAIAVNMAPVPPGGEADYTPYAGSFPDSDCVPGTETVAPDQLCQVTPLTRAIYYTASESTPALYTIPPVAPASKVQCLGLPFDFGANQIADGWICVAAEATDYVGNHGVSPPVRLWVNKSASLSQKGSVPPGGGGSAPGCTGTLNPATGQVSAGQPCKFRKASQAFPQVYPDASLLIEQMETENEEQQ